MKMADVKRYPLATVHVTTTTSRAISPCFDLPATLYQLVIYEHVTDPRLLTLAIESRGRDSADVVLASCDVFVSGLTGAMPDVLRRQSRDVIDNPIMAALLRGAAAAIDEAERGDY